MHKGSQDLVHVSEISLFQHHQSLISSGSTEAGVKGRLPRGGWIHLSKLYYRWANSTRFPSSQMATALVFVWTVPWKYSIINLWVRQIVVSPLYCPPPLLWCPWTPCRVYASCKASSIMHLFRIRILILILEFYYSASSSIWRKWWCFPTSMHWLWISPVSPSKGKLKHYIYIYKTNSTPIISQVPRKIKEAISKNNSLFRFFFSNYTHIFQIYLFIYL